MRYLCILLVLLAGCVSSSPVQYVYDSDFVDTLSVFRAASECGLSSEEVVQSFAACHENRAELVTWQKDVYRQCREKVPGYVDCQGIRSRMVLLECWNAERQKEMDSLQPADRLSWEKRMQSIVRQAEKDMQAKYRNLEKAQ